MLRYEAHRIAINAVRTAHRTLRHYTDRNTDFTEKLFVRIDVIEEFPFLVTKLSPYFDRYPENNRR